MKTSPVLLGLILLISCPLVAAEMQVRIPAGQTVDVWFGANVSGKLYYSIASRDGSNAVNFWWIKWGFGSVEQLGVHHGAGLFDIPISWWKGIFSAKLRASAASDTIIHIQENTSLNANLSFHW
jgi:hypothetical protein